MKILSILRFDRSLLSVLSLEVLIGVLGDIMPQNLKDSLELFIKNTFGSYIEDVWSKIWIFLFCATFLIFLWLSLKKEKSGFEDGKGANFLSREEIVRNLLVQYNDRLSQKLDKRIALNLSLKYTNEGTRSEYTQKYFAPIVKNEKEIRANLSTVLEKYSRLLILGEPGAGKTTLLLDLALELLERAKGDPTIPVPVIFNLVSWKDDDVGDWIKGLLVTNNGFDKDLAAEWVESRQIIPFFDGLDEIPDAKTRSACLEKIRLFLLANEPKKLVICSRIEEYKEIPADASVSVSLIVHPLNPVQVRKVLKSIVDDVDKQGERPFANQTAARNILHLMNESAHFAEIICTPLYFNIASFVFETTDLKSDPLPVREDISDYLVEEFVGRKISQGSKLFPSKGKNIYWLSWLAKLLNRESIVTLSLADPQPRNLKWPLVHGGIIGFLHGLFFWMVASLFTTFLVSSVVALILGCLFGVTYFVSGRIDARNMNDFVQKLSHLSGWWTVPIFILILNMTIGYLISFIIGLLSGIIGALVAGINYGLFAGLLYGVATTMISGLAYSTVMEMTTMPFIMPTVIGSGLVSAAGERKPYRFLMSSINFILIKWGLTFCLTISFIKLYGGAGFWEFLYFALLGFILGVVGAILNSMLFSHLILRLCFFFEGSMPLRFVSFLDYATQLRILERDGSQWRFKHKILQNYIANTETSLS